MNRDTARSMAKRALGQLPLTAELYQRWVAIDQAPPHGFELERLVDALPGWVAAASRARSLASLTETRRVLVMGYLQWWVEYACALSLLLAAMGYRTGLAFLPYRRWTGEVQPFDLRRQRAYMLRVLGRAGSLLRLHDLSTVPPRSLPAELQRELELLSRIDVQYTVQREEIEIGKGGADESLYRLRLTRNQAAAAAAVELLGREDYQVVVIPNGSILEFGAVYRTARHLEVPVVTYEFGEQRQRMWLAQDDEVMRLDTSRLWQARGELPLMQAETEAVQTMNSAREGATEWSNFARRWQARSAKGAGKVRRELELDDSRPLVLLCTNVVGDSLALGREVFTRGMADWLSLTVKHLGARPDVQLVVRVHPGELLGAGHPSMDILRAAYPELPDQVRAVPPGSDINTYDLIELADVGLVYTTTVGLEMAMKGIPVIVAGRTHYRGKGFTYDPEARHDYLDTLDQLLADPESHRLGASQVELAWRYAYRFFFEFPFSFPWHLIRFWDDMAKRPFEDLVKDGGDMPYTRTVRALVGLPISLN